MVNRQYYLLFLIKRFITIYWSSTNANLANFRERLLMFQLVNFVFIHGMLNQLVTRPINALLMSTDWMGYLLRMTLVILHRQLLKKNILYKATVRSNVIKFEYLSIISHDISRFVSYQIDIIDTLILLSSSV